MDNLKQVGQGPCRLCRVPYPVLICAQARLLEARLEEARQAQRMGRRQQLRHQAAAVRARRRHALETVSDDVRSPHPGCGLSVRLS